MNPEKREWLVNRIHKNQKKLKKFLTSWQTNAYRVYDKDIPEIPYQIDKLDKEFWITEKGVHHTKIEQDLQFENRKHISDALMSVFGCADENLWWQIRQDKEVTLEEYHREKEIFVEEGGLKFLLKLGPYRDVGLFLDHRLLRLKLAREKHTIPLRVLNLFSYTGAFSVHLANQGHLTHNVDMSKTYLDWCKKNFEINNLALTNHKFFQEDILQWLPKQHSSLTFDLIILDPPSFSNSKKMGQEVLDIQRDHVMLIDHCLKILTLNSGILYFSTNLRSFKMDSSILQSPSLSIVDITKETIPCDFRDEKIHRCFKIMHKKKGH